MRQWFPLWEPKCVNGFHIWSPNVSMVSTFGAQTRQWFPHLEPKCVNGFHIWSPNASMVSTLGAKMCQWFPHLEPNRVMIFTLGAQICQWFPHLEPERINGVQNYFSETQHQTSSSNLSSSLNKVNNSTSSFNFKFELYTLHATSNF